MFKKLKRVPKSHVPDVNLRHQNGDVDCLLNRCTSHAINSLAVVEAFDTALGIVNHAFNAIDEMVPTLLFFVQQATALLGGSCVVVRLGLEPCCPSALPAAPSFVVWAPFGRLLSVLWAPWSRWALVPLGSGWGVVPCPIG